MAIPSIDVRTFDVDDIIICLENQGYTIDQNNFDFARDGAFKYNGYSNGHHKYLIGFQSDTNKNEYEVSRVFIGFNHLGEIATEHAGCIQFVGSYDGALDYIQRTYN